MNQLVGKKANARTLTGPGGPAVEDARIPDRWLPLVRGSWLVIVLLSVIIYLASISPHYNEVRQVCSGDECLFFALSPPEEKALTDFGITLVAYAGYIVAVDILAFVVLVPLAVLIYLHRSGTWVGFLFSLTLLMLGTTTSLGVPALAREFASFSWFFDALEPAAAITFCLVVFLFPDGRFVPRWASVFILSVTGAAFVLMLFQQMAPGSGLWASLLNVLFSSSFLVGVLAQAYRYFRVSYPIQRQQTKWIVFGLLTVLVIVFVYVLLVEFFPLQPGRSRLVFKFSFGLLLLVWLFFPFTVAFSILRYRLWDIDIVINRALVYGLLATALALAYAINVVLLQALFRSLTGQGSPVSIVVSTLAIAALFGPLRTRIQAGIDRRFYRRKYDAEKVLAAFAATLRDEVDLEKLGDALVTVVEETMQPEHASYWLAKRNTPR